jgi:RNA polymerase sigma-70 factor, ECF subfamily
VTRAKKQPAVEDASLVAAIQAGNEDAMATLYDRFAQIVYSVGLRVLGDTAAAEDVMQEVFMQLWRNPQAFSSSRGSMGAWLAVIARHRAIDHLRRRKTETDIEDVVISVDARIDDEVERHAFLGKIRNVLSGLPEQQRKAIEMSFFDGLTHSEIAKKTGDPLGTIKTRIRTALTSVRRALATA